MFDNILNDIAEPHYGRGKRIKFWKNGDQHSKCYDIYINPNVLRTWNSILTYLTDYINPEFGAVRKVFSLKTGNSVCCFQDLDPNNKYVIGPRKSKLQYIQNGYVTPSETELSVKRERKKFYSADFNPSNYKFLAETSKRNLTIIFLLVSGRPCQKPAKIVLRPTDLIRWNKTLNLFAKLIDVPDGIQHLFTVFGNLICSPYDLQHGFVYVAVPFGEKFKCMNYLRVFKRMAIKGCHAVALNVRPSSPDETNRTTHLSKLKKIKKNQKDDQPIEKMCGNFTKYHCSPLRNTPDILNCSQESIDVAKKSSMNCTKTYASNVIAVYNTSSMKTNKENETQDAINNSQHKTIAGRKLSSNSIEKICSLSVTSVHVDHSSLLETNPEIKKPGGLNDIVEEGNESLRSIESSTSEGHISQCGCNIVDSMKNDPEKKTILSYCLREIKFESSNPSKETLIHLNNCTSIKFYGCSKECRNISKLKKKSRKNNTKEKKSSMIKDEQNITTENASETSVDEDPLVNDKEKISGLPSCDGKSQTKNPNISENVREIHSASSRNQTTSKNLGNIQQATNSKLNTLFQNDLEYRNSTWADSFEKNLNNKPPDNATIPNSCENVFENEVNPSSRISSTSKTIKKSEIGNETVDTSESAKVNRIYWGNIHHNKSNVIKTENFQNRSDVLENRNDIFEREALHNAKKNNVDTGYSKIESVNVCENQQKPSSRTSNTSKNIGKSVIRNEIEDIPEYPENNKTSWGNILHSKSNVVKTENFQNRSDVLESRNEIFEKEALHNAKENNLDTGCTKIESVNVWENQQKPSSRTSNTFKTIGKSEIISEIEDIPEYEKKDITSWGNILHSKSNIAKTDNSQSQSNALKTFGNETLHYTKKNSLQSDRSGIRSNCDSICQNEENTRSRISNISKSIGKPDIRSKTELPSESEKKIPLSGSNLLYTISYVEKTNNSQNQLNVQANRNETFAEEAQYDVKKSSLHTNSIGSQSNCENVSENNQKSTSKLFKSNGENKIKEKNFLGSAKQNQTFNGTVNHAKKKLSYEYQNFRDQYVQTETSFMKTASLDFDSIKIKCYERRSNVGKDVNNSIERLLEIVTAGKNDCICNPCRRSISCDSIEEVE